MEFSTFEIEQLAELFAHTKAPIETDLKGYFLLAKNPALTFSLRFRNRRDRKFW